MTDPHPSPAPVPPARQGGIAARARAAAGPAYLQGLNPEQQRAVETLDGPVLVLAGAGTGKTRVLTTRLAHILTLGLARPGQILAVTFTNKAAREMKERIGGLIGESVEGMPWLGTFHSICVKILRRHAELVGLKRDFTILDVDDQIRLLKQVIQAADLDEKRWPARQLANFIDGWKNKALTPDKVPPGDAYAFAGKGDELYAAYQARLKTLNAVDFGDLLLETIRLFRENADVLADFQSRFRYMLVDEYQDTNVAQYLWLRLLAQRTGEDEKANLCCVGDDDQSIYGWRGAEVDNILRFEADFPGAVVIRLERNYRSTSNILDAASHLIAHNEGRLGKTLHGQGEAGDKVTVTCAWDSEEEARLIGEEIEQLQRKGENLDEMAILVRASFQMREFEDRFVTLGLPYRVIGGPRFYERAEIRDAIAYLRATAQPADDLAFERIINTPRRGIGDVTVRTIHDVARSRGIPMMQAALELTESEELKARARNAVRNLVTDFARWRGQLDQMPQSELAAVILEESGYTEMWQRERSPDAPGRLENLKELLRSMEEFDSLTGFLEHISLVMDTEAGDQEDKVSLMTLHAAKGLEFGTVFLPGWEEGLFPHQRSMDENGRAGLEEERRLAYVGLTRAKRRAALYFATNRRIHGLWQATAASRFLDELPEANIEVIDTGSLRTSGAYGHGGGNYGSSRFDEAEPFASTYSTPGWQRAKKNKARAASNPWKEAPMLEGEVLARSTGTASAYARGERVFHQKFGYGEITAVDGNKLTVDFDHSGPKRVLDSFVERH